MTSPASSPAQTRLDAIRNRLASASPEWGIVAGEQLAITAGNGADMAEVLTFFDNVYVDDRDLVLHAHDDLAWLLQTYEYLAMRYRELLAESRRAEQARKAKDHAAECAMLCGRQAFRTFLQQRHGLDVADGERVNTRVRSILAIQSRAELNTDEAARQRWFSLRAEFKQWQEGR